MREAAAVLSRRERPSKPAVDLMQGEAAPPGTVHLRYKVRLRARLHDRMICDLIETAASFAGIPKSLFAVLDVGCGSGHLMQAARERALDITGADIDPVCVRLSSRFSKAVLLPEGGLGEAFEKDMFDCLVFSHSLEHFENPVGAVKEAKRISRRFLIFAVPNPCRLQTVLVTNPLRYDYANLGHTCCWDRSHLNVFLSEKCGLNILKWQPYKIGLSGILPALPKALKPVRSRDRSSGPLPERKPGENRPGKSTRRLAKEVLEPLEIYLARKFPYFSDELLVLTEIADTDSRGGGSRS